MAGLIRHSISGDLETTSAVRWYRRASFENGAAFFLVAVPDPLDHLTWFVNFSSMAGSGWHDIKMVEIACDDAHQNWNWGFQSAVVSRTWPNETYDDIPFVFGLQNNQPFGSFYPNIEHAQTTSADIDHTNGKTYAVYDLHNTARGSESAIPPPGLCLRLDSWYRCGNQRVR